MPDLNNAEKWFNRIVNNLLYYQVCQFMVCFAGVYIDFEMYSYDPPPPSFIPKTILLTLSQLAYYFIIYYMPPWYLGR